MLLHISGILFLLGKFLIASSTEPKIEQGEEVVELLTPSVAKSEFITAIKELNLESARKIVEDHPFITNQFNADVFAEIIACYPKTETDKNAICDQFYELISPSLFELSKSHTTPLIMAVFGNNLDVFNKLIEDPNHLLPLDAHHRTALMYAARLGREYMMIRMVQFALPKLKNPVDLLNVQDKDKKTVLHHLCESNQSEEDKIRWTRILKENGALVNKDIPYPVDVWNVDLRREFSSHGAEVIHKDWNKSVAMAASTLRGYALLTVLVYRHAFAEAVIPHLFTLLNSLPIRALQTLFYYIGMLAFEGFDMNVVISFNLPSGNYDFSFNVLMLLFLALLFSQGHKIQSELPFNY